jgi:hypothetical protein
MLQAELKRGMVNNGLWSKAWATIWQQQQQLDGQPALATVYKSAVLDNGMQVNSVQYLRSRSRNATRVMPYFASVNDNLRPYAAEVQLLVELQRPAASVGQHAAAAAGGGDGESSSGAQDAAAI